MVSTDSSFWRGRIVCVTGGAGFLGLHLVQRLRDCGAAVRVFGLAPRPGHPLLAFADVERIDGDVRDREQVRRALVGCDVVFHTAGTVGVWGPALERMRSVHVDGTRNVVETAPGRARIVHTSSVVAVGASRSGQMLDEESPFELADCGLPYCEAKRASEEVALASGRDVVVTNPAYLLGPDDDEPSVMGRLCHRYWRGRLPFAPPGGVNFADVRDVAEGHLLAAERGITGRRYILGGDNRTFADFMRELAATSRFAPRGQPRLPRWLFAAIAGFGEVHGLVTGNEPYPGLGHVRLNRYFWFYRSDRAHAELGFRCRPLADTLADTHRWFRDQSSMGLGGLRRWWLRPAG
jgi:dihydroflavonol-4-reductase